MRSKSIYRCPAAANVPRPVPYLRPAVPVVPGKDLYAMSDEPYVPPADPMSDRLAWTMVGVFVIICWVAIVLGTWLILTHPDAPADRPGVVATPTTYAPPRVPAPVPAGAR